MSSLELKFSDLLPDLQEPIELAISLLRAVNFFCAKLPP